MALYSRGGVTSATQSHELHYARFHWAIWTEPKGSTGMGSCYQVLKGDSFVNVPGSGGWRFDYSRTANYTRSNAMLGRIMVGKIPSNVSPDHVSAIVSRIPLPRDNVAPVENCVSWTMAALQELQRHSWVDDFNVQGFMDHALDRASCWYRDNYNLRRNVKENYTERKFP